MSAGKWAVAGWLAIFLASSSSVASEQDEEHHGASAAAELSQLDPHTATVARRLWGDLVCLCHRCERLTLSACHCPDAARERKQIVDLLRGHDLSSPTAEQAAYRAVVTEFVRQKGRDVLTSSRPNALATDWLVLLIAGTVFALACFVVGVIQTRRKAAGRLRRGARR